MNSTLISGWQKEQERNKKREGGKKERKNIEEKKRKKKIDKNDGGRFVSSFMQSCTICQ